MRVLLTNNTLDRRAGTELYLADLARGLLARGHEPVAYSPRLGEVAEELRRATVPVVDDLAALGEPPDLIHGQHHVETLTALLAFPGVPAVAVCHGWLPWEETPLRFPRILRHVAVDHTVRDRLISQGGIPAGRVEVILNAVDLARFRPRGPLPPRPRRALVFSNQANEWTHLGPVRDACARLGIPVDVVGVASGRSVSRPEELLPGYDLVFAKARAALEALAVGTAVVLCDQTGAGPLVTSADLDRLRPLNFGIRTLSHPLDPAYLASQIERYDPADAARVAARIRAEAGLEQVVDRYLGLYESVLAEHRARPSVPPEEALEEESRIAAAYLRWLAPFLQERAYLAVDLDTARQQAVRLAAELDTAHQEAALLRGQLGHIRATAVWKAREWAARWAKRGLGRL